MKQLAPIILFVYNRLWHTQQTVEALQKNDLASESELFIYADGAKQENDPKVAEVRNYIKTISGFKKITIIERKKNWGLADNIIDGVTEIVNKYGRIIVLEDDIVTSVGFLKYMNDALTMYQEEDKVRQVSGYQYNIVSEKIKIPILHRRTTSWGWATWERAWSLFNLDIENLISLFTLNERITFNIDGTTDRYSMLELQRQGKINSWAIRWAASLHLRKSLVLWPPYSLIKNIGHDGSGVHCGNSVEQNKVVIQNDVIPYIYPKKIKENLKYLLKIKKYYFGFSKRNIYSKIRFLIKHYYTICK